MKKLNLLLLILLMVLLILVGWFFIGGRLNVAVSSPRARASEQPEALSSIASILSSSTAPQSFAGPPADLQGCTLIDATLTLSNMGFFPAEWVSAQVIPAAGDIAVYSLTGEGSNVPAFGSGQVNLKLITQDAAAVRTVRLTYYVFGMKRTIDIRL